MNVEQSVERLNELLKGEFAAIGSYRQTIERVPDTELKTQLEEIHVAHEARANHLRARVQELGGEPFDGETFSVRRKRERWSTKVSGSFERPR